MDGIADIDSNDTEEPVQTEPTSVAAPAPTPAATTPKEPTYNQQAQQALFANQQIISLQLEQSMRQQGY